MLENVCNCAATPAPEKISCSCGTVNSIPTTLNEASSNQLGFSIITILLFIIIIVCGIVSIILETERR